MSKNKFNYKGNICSREDILKNEEVKFYYKGRAYFLESPNESRSIYLGWNDGKKTKEANVDIITDDYIYCSWYMLGNDISIRIPISDIKLYGYEIDKIKTRLY